MTKMREQMRNSRFTMTLTYEYTRTPRELEVFYGTTDLTEAAAIDQRNFVEDPDFITDELKWSNRPFTVTVHAEEITE